MLASLRRHHRAPLSVERIAAPSVAEFHARYVAARRPVIITGLVDRWPAMARWSPAYLRDHVGEHPVQVARLQDGRVCRDPDVGIVYEEVAVRRAVELIFSDAGGYYLVGLLDRTMGPLLDDVAMPDYCRGMPRLRNRFWMGARGAVSPLHRDFPENLHAQVVGRKRWTILDPGDDDKVYEHPFLSRMPRFSPVDPERPDLARFPRFAGARPHTFTLEPGEMLYLPGRWWHQVTALESSISINWWWARGWVRWMVTAADAVKWIRGVRL